MTKYEEDGSWYLMSGRLGPTSVDVSIEDPLVTIGSLMDVWADNLEGANYHSMTSVPENLVKTLERAGIGEEQIKKVLWDIIENQGGWI